MSENAGGFTPITSQEQFDAVIKSRLERARKTEAERFADYEDLKDKAQTYEENATKLREANAEVTRLQAELAERDRLSRLQDARMRVSSETGVPALLVTGDTEQAMRENAARLVAYKNGQRGGAPAKGHGREPDPESLRLARIISNENK